MNDFKWRHFEGDLMLNCVRWYCRYGISCRDLEEMLLERGMVVDRTTIYCYVIQYAPEMEKRLRYFSNRPWAIVGRLMRRMSKSKACGSICTEP